MKWRFWERDDDKCPPKQHDWPEWQQVNTEPTKHHYPDLNVRRCRDCGFTESYPILPMFMWSESRPECVEVSRTASDKLTEESDNYNYGQQKAENNG